MISWTGRRSASSVVALTFLAFGLLFCWSEYASWQGEVARIEVSLEETAQAIAQHSDDIVEMSRLPLASMIAEIATEDSPGADLAGRLRANIRLQMRASPTLDALSYLAPDGTLVASSVANLPANFDYSDREYFRFHETRPFRLPVLGKPFKSRLSGEWVIPISQKVFGKGGTFGGVVVSMIRVNHFVNFFRNFSVGVGGSFLIVRGDGVILSRAPVQENLLATNIASQELFTQLLPRQKEGAYHYKSPVDGTVRIGGYFQSSRTGIVVLAAMSKHDAFLAWLAQAGTRWLYGGLTCTIALVAFGYWRRQSRFSSEQDALLAAREAQFRLLAESSSDVISRFDEAGVREYVSPSARQVLGIDPEDLVGRSLYLGISAEAADIIRSAIARLKAGSSTEVVVFHWTKPCGEKVWLETSLSKLPATRTLDGLKIVAISRDITGQKKAQDHLDALANTDELTGLANRRAFNSRFERLMEQSQQMGQPLSLLVLDVDRFKLFNDTYGHAVGDDCLQKIAHVIRDGVTGPDDVVARFGGEEIAVLLSDTDSRGAWKLAENIRMQVSGLEIPHQQNLPSCRVTISIGVATLVEHPENHISAQTLFAMADTALYRAKNSGRNRVVLSEPEIPRQLSLQGRKTNE